MREKKVEMTHLKEKKKSTRNFSLVGEATGLVKHLYGWFVKGVARRGESHEESSLPFVHQALLLPCH